MAKIKKTRQQKIKADSRRIVSESSTYSLASAPKTYSRSVTPNSDQHPVSATTSSLLIKTMNYDYLVHDLRKTGLVTALIITAQLILYFFLNK